MVPARIGTGPQTFLDQYHREDFQNLYQREEPHTHGVLLATHVEPIQVNGVNPSETVAEAKVNTVVRHLRQLNEGRHTHFRAEQFKQWLQ